MRPTRQPASSECVCVCVICKRASVSTHFNIWQQGIKRFPETPKPRTQHTHTYTYTYTHSFPAPLSLYPSLPFRVSRYMNVELHGIWGRGVPGRLQPEAVTATNAAAVSIRVLR